MTATPTPRRYARVREEHGRLLLTFYAYDRATVAAIKGDLRQSFPRHGERCWRHAGQCWSFPAHHRQRLHEWLASWFPAGAVTWARTRQPENRPTPEKESAWHGARPAAANAVKPAAQPPPAPSTAAPHHGPGQKPRGQQSPPSKRPPWGQRRLRLSSPPPPGPQAQ